MAVRLAIACVAVTALVPTGATATVRAPAAERARGEALAMHRGWRPRARRTVRAWMQSPAHRAVLLGGFRHAGAGLKRGRFRGRLATVWVLHVGRR